MPEDRLITVAIHTYEKATVLKSVLENEGIQVALQNVNLVQPVISSGVRVRIHESDLPKALRIIESSDVFCEDATLDTEKKAEVAPVIMVPVDFSTCSEMACEVGFRLAARHKAEVVVIHSFISPTIGSSIQLTDSLDFDFDDIAEEDEVRLTIEEAAAKQLDEFAEKLRLKIRDGKLYPAKFTTRLVDDVAEDAIHDLAKEIKPLAIVMGTRGAGRKELEMVGSVTAEVLDSCRYPVFTVPDGHDGLSASDDPRKGHVIFFCNYEQNDLLALDLFYRLFPEGAFDVTLVNIPTKKMPANTGLISQGLLNYCKEHLPRFKFDVMPVAVNDMETIFHQIETSGHIDFIAVPNKKRNIFSRLFNPGLAHRLLFHTDIPLVVLPV